MAYEAIMSAHARLGSQLFSSLRLSHKIKLKLQTGKLSFDHLFYFESLVKRLIEIL